MNASQAEYLLPAIVKAPIFRHMSEEGHRFLALNAGVREYQAGEIVGAQGSAVGCMFGVLEGMLRGLKFSSDGHRMLFMYLAQGDWAGHYWAAGGSTAVMDVEAAVLSRCVLISNSVLREAGRRWPTLYEGMYMELVRLTHPLFERIELEKNHLLRERVSRILLSLLGDPKLTKSAGQALKVNISQAEIADFAFCSRQHANRTLQELADAGIISRIGRKMILVNDLDGLIGASQPPAAVGANVARRPI